jgi:hypothetical protein
MFSCSIVGNVSKYERRNGYLPDEVEDIHASGTQHVISRTLFLKQI